MVVLILMVSIMIFMLYLPLYSRNEVNSCTEDEIKNIKDIMFSTCFFQRVLMVEVLSGQNSLIVNEKDEKDENDILFGSTRKTSESEEITMQKISVNIENMRKLLVRPFGGSAAKKISNLLLEKNKIVQEFYESVKLLSSNNQEILKHDLTKTIDNISNQTIKKLDKTSHQICDQMGINISDQNEDYDKKSPILNNKKFYSLMSMYDLELLNQAKTYGSKNFATSLNHSQSLLEISYHLSNELATLIKNNSQNTEFIM